MFELLTGFTPFSSSTDNGTITQLFTNIAMVQKRGLILPSQIDSVEGKEGKALFVLISFNSH